jgi:hypothetical protein
MAFAAEVVREGLEVLAGSYRGRFGFAGELLQFGFTWGAIHQLGDSQGKWKRCVEHHS